MNVVVGVTGSARQAVERFKAGEYASAAAPNVTSHFGVAAGGPPGGGLGAGFDRFLTRGPGMGIGRGGGMGGGRGMGGRCGMGGGRGMGRGRGMGLGMGQRQNAGMWGFAGTQALGARAGALQSGRKAVALVRTEKCAGCGICVDVCPVGAIGIEQQHAVVNPTLCTACAACVRECPNEAVIVVQHRT